MSEPPDRPKIYHITHVCNLIPILKSKALFSDRAMGYRGGPNMSIGMPEIKSRRMTMPVACHPGDKVGEYVPFYFCARSIMLYMLHMGNHPALNYRGGQAPIVHLEADLHRVVEWADSQACRWAISLSNAGTFHAEFRDSLAALHEINWTAVQAQYWTDPDIHDGKQAEFLLRRLFPWHLVERIGVYSAEIKSQVVEIIGESEPRPTVRVCRNWYY